MGGLVNLIQPAVVKASGRSGDKLENAVLANVEDGVARLKSLEPIVAKAVRDGAVKVVGATYDLRTGRLTILS